MINGSSTIKLSVASLRLVSPGRQLTVSHLVFFLLKNWRPLLVFSSRLSPQTFFYLFDLVFPLFSVNSATFFSFGCSVFPWRVLPGAVPPVTPLNTISHLVKVTVGYIANTIEVGQMGQPTIIARQKLVMKRHWGIAPGDVLQGRHPNEKMWLTQHKRGSRI